MTTYVLAIDQGTTSTRAMIFDHGGRIVSTGQLDHQQIFPRAGWVEHDAVEIWDNVREVVGLALTRANLTSDDLEAVGIANQRETVVVWDRRTGVPIANAIVWQDTRTQSLVDAFEAEVGEERLRAITGLPAATYFSGPKITWLLDHVPNARAAAEAGHLLFGTIDSWLVWNMTGGVDGGRHVTDVTNASRTMLMDLGTLAWSDELVAALRIPAAMLPQITSSSAVHGVGRPHGLLGGVPIAGILGDQQAAMFGQTCFAEGDVKATYGTGGFILLNTGERAVVSEHGLLTTVCYQIGDAPPVFALEGSIAVAGALVQWLRDNLGILSDAAQVETLALEVANNGGAYFVPAFSGLFAPHWRSDARGALVGLTGYVTRQHIARAALEATAYQTRDVVDAMSADAGVRLNELRVDGGMVVNEFLMQFQADQLGCDVIRPRVSETTALGAAFAAGLAVGFWEGQAEVLETWAEQARWSPSMPRTESDRLYRGWLKAITKSVGWVDAQA